MRLSPLVEPGPPLSREQVQRYSRHLLLGQLGHDGQRRLLASRVAVVGAGGLGAPVLQYLAAAGVGHLTIIDDDDVDPSNLQRQVIHTMADVGRPKVDSAAEKVRALNPEVEVSTHGRLDATNARQVLDGHHLVLDGTDNFPTRYLVSDTCADLAVPVVWGSILRFDAQISVFWSSPVPADSGPDPADGGRNPGTSGTPVPAPGRNESVDPAAIATGSTLSSAGVTLRDLFPYPPPEGTTPSCGQAGVLGAMCGQVGSIMATEAIKLLTGTGEPLLGRVLVLDALTQRWSEIPVRARPAATTVRAESSPVHRVVNDVPARRGSDGNPILEHSSEAPEGSGETPEVSSDGQDAQQRSITAAELAARITARERGTDDFVLLDVREEPERTIVAIPGAVGIPLGEVLTDPDGVVHRLDLHRPGGVARELLVHCRSGQRSAQAVRALADAGARAINVRGGVLAWVADVDPELPTY
ncbi:ThiF family adenylyltransferase [Georgenia halophila]|uniref:ThiF family adenylyltransferase n=1 Tax=Georgenia halophila TaxID=620889 RepID=A0ABP8LG03_9MICO